MIIASDIHISEVKGKPILLDVLSHAVIADIDRILIIAGDLTCSASQQEIEPVSEWFNKLMEDGASIVLCPGNHDTSLTILITRIRLKNRARRFSTLADYVEQQPIVVARRDDFDMIYKVGKDVFFAARSTHHDKLKNQTRIKRKQFEWAKLILKQEGLLPEKGCRLHLVTHQSLWKLPKEGAFKGDKHDHMHKRTRLRKEFLEPLGFSTAINGHNHGFAHGMRGIKDYQDYSMYHIQAPTLSEHKTKGGKCTPGFVKWNPEKPCSAQLVLE